MNDLISLSKAVEEIARRDTTDGTVKVFSGQEVIGILRDLPLEDPDKEADYWFRRSGHYEEIITKLTKIIAEHPKQIGLIHCGSCVNYDRHGRRCKYWNHGVISMDYCSKAEREPDE